MKNLRLNKENTYLLIIAYYLWVMIFTESQISEITFAGTVLKAARFSVIILAFGYFVRFSEFKTKKKGILFKAILGLTVLINFLYFDGGTSLLTMVLLIVTSDGVSLEKIFRVSLLHLMLAQITVIALCKVGILEDVVLSRIIQESAGGLFAGEYSKHTYGFLNANQLPTTFFIMLILYFVWRKNKVKPVELVVFAIANRFLFLKCSSRVAYLLTILLILSYLVIAVLGRKTRILDFFMRASIKAAFFPILVAFTFWSALSRQNEDTFTKLDYILNFRPRFNYMALTYYGGISAFGYGDAGASREVLEKALDVDYLVIDNGFLFLLIQRGWIIGILILCMYAYLLYFAAKVKNIYLFLGIILFGLENIVNSHLMSYKILPMLCILMNQKDPFLKVQWRHKETILLAEEMCPR